MTIKVKYIWTPRIVAASLSVVILLLFAALLSSCSSAPEVAPAAADTEAARTQPQQSRTDRSDTPADDRKTEPWSAPSYTGTVPAPPIPQDIPWLNTNRPLTWKDLRGKVVILDFWTYGCINCIHNLPYLKKLETEFPDSLVVIGVHSAKFDTESQTAHIRQVIMRYGIEHPVINDANLLMWRQWSVTAWPTLYLVDPAGKVVGRRIGEGFYPAFHDAVSSLVKEFSARGQINWNPLSLTREADEAPRTLLSYPGKVLADAEGKRLFVSDSSHNRVLVSRLPSGDVTAIIGTGNAGFSDGPFDSAELSGPQGLALSEDGRYLYIADTKNHSIRRADLQNKTLSTFAGTGAMAGSYPPATGKADKTALSSPWDLALSGSTLYVAMAGSHQLWTMDTESGKTAYLAGTGAEGYDDGPALQATLAQPSGITLGQDGTLFFADSEGSTIRMVRHTGDTSVVKTLAGSGTSLFEFGDVDGAGNTARLQHPLGVAASGGLVYVADTYNSKIKVLDPSTRRITTLSGGDSAGWADGKNARFDEPGGVSAANGTLYVADTNNQTIREVNMATGETGTLTLKMSDPWQSARSSGNEKRVTERAPISIAPGTTRLTVEITLPDGYKVNDEAVSGVRLSVVDGPLSLPDPSRSASGLTFPLTFHIDGAGTGGTSGTIQAEFSVVYCRSDEEGVCLLENVVVKAPYRVTSDGSSHPIILHKIILPKSNGLFDQ